MRVEDRELEAVVLQEPRLRIDVELEAVRRLERVPPGHVALRTAVAEHDQSAGFIRRFRAGVVRQLGAKLGRDHHQTLSSIARDTSAASQKSAERYFQPPSARMQTTTPSSSSPASLLATWVTAPEETPANSPSASRSARTPATDSSFDTSTFRSSFDTSRIGGT